jgi:hypothetical protein
VPPFLERSGQRYGRVIAQWPCGKNKHEQIVWMCVCDCGQLTLKTAPFKLSCGCLLRESAARNGRSTKGKPRPDAIGNDWSVKHGGCRNGLSPAYQSFAAAKQRCNDPGAENYPDYGGRGIKFLFPSYEQWISELGPRPDGHTVDRINVNGNYKPGNVRWATAKEQRHNQRKRRRRNAR